MCDDVVMYQTLVSLQYDISKNLNLCANRTAPTRTARLLFSILLSLQYCTVPKVNSHKLNIILAAYKLFLYSILHLFKHLATYSLAMMMMLRVSSSYQALRKSARSRALVNPLLSSYSCRSGSSHSQWENQVNRELKNHPQKWTVDDLRSKRYTAEGLCLQPVYYNLDAEDPELPGVFPYTRGPYSTM